jgi:hypothetical protein
MEQKNNKSVGMKLHGGRMIGLGLAIGVAIGAGMGAAIDNTGAGIGMGIAVGVAIGYTTDLKSRAGDNSNQK